MKTNTLTANFTKVVRIGALKSEKARPNVYCKIEFNDGRLSISGVVGPKSNGDAFGGCGQIEMEFQHRNPAHDDKRYHSLIKPEDFDFAPGWNDDMLFDFLDAWHVWHLNDMQAACEHQRALGWTWTTHPSAECPTCAYKLGHSWLKMEVPAAILEFLSSLPTSDMKPAWV